MTAISQSTAETDIYSEMGLVPVINACGNQTLLGGSILSPEIREAMDAANRYFVAMEDLFAETGKMVAELLECEAAYITSGCAAALVLGTAACIAGDDVAKIRALPHTQGMRNKVLIQGPHRYKYEHVTTIVGTKLIEVGDADSVSAEQLEAALGLDTAAVLFPAHLDSVRGIVPLAEVIEIAHRNGAAVLVDAASQLYPLERMLGWTKMGADLVCFGAKYFGAPHSSGILCGRKDLVESAVSQGFIGFETGASAFGRPLKLDRAEIIAVVLALKNWMTRDHEERIADAQAKLDPIAAALEGLDGVNSSIVPGINIGAPGLRVDFEAASGLTREKVIAELESGNPSIVVGEVDGALLFNPNTLHEGDEEVVAERLRSVVSG